MTNDNPSKAATHLGLDERTGDPLDDQLVEALASGREDLVDAETLARLATDPALRDEVARARALSLDVGLLLDDGHPPVDIGALVQRAIQSAPPVIERRHLRLAGLFALVSTFGFGLLSLPRVPGWADLVRTTQLAGSFASSTASALGRLPVGAGFAAVCVCIGVVLLVGRGFRRAPRRKPPRRFGASFGPGVRRGVA